MRRTSTGRSISSHPGQNGRCTIIVQNSKVRMSDIWIRLPKHKWPKSWSSMEDPVVPLERNLYGHRLAGLLWESQFEKILLNETKHQSDLDNTNESRWFGRTNIIPRPCLFGLHSKRMSDEQRYCGQLQEYVRIQNLCWSYRKASKYMENWYEHFLMVLLMCKVMQRNVWKDIANWRTKQPNSYTKSQHHTLTTTNSRKKKWDL